MDKFLKQYLEQAQETIGDRSADEIAYDNIIVEALNMGCSLKVALAKAASKYPNEALQVNATTIDDVAAHYEYLRQHAAIIQGLQKMETQRPRQSPGT